VSAAETPILAECTCGDVEELQLLRDLILHDVDQWDASLIAFGGRPRTDAPWWVHRLWARLEARRLGNQVRRDLGLPEVPLAFEPTDLPSALIDQAAPIAEQAERMRQIAADLVGPHGKMRDAIDSLHLALRGYVHRRTDRFTLRGPAPEIRLPNAPAKVAR